MDQALNKKDYLKKYLSGSDKKRKKKKKIVLTSSSSLKPSKIVDDDIDNLNTVSLDDNGMGLYDVGEDAPQIVGIVDERPVEVRVESEYRQTSKWKVIANENEHVVTSNDGAVSDKGDKHKNSDSDVSIKRNKKNDSDESPPRRVRAHDREKDDSDFSPPRPASERKPASTRVPSGKTRSDSDTDLSPPRKGRPTLSPPRKRSIRDEDGDLSPPRKTRRKDLSPKRKPRNKSPPKKESEDHSHQKRVKNEREDSKKKTLEGKKAGLQNAADMKKEAEELRRRQAESLALLGDDASGRGAKAIVRDKKTGKIRDLKEEARKKKEKEAKEAEMIEKYAVWGKGIKQIEDRVAKMSDDLHEMSKPMARYVDDEDLEEMRRNEEREGDPMLEYMRSKRRKEGKLAPTRPEFFGSYMPNRYNIRPGHRWDGVDRSNGYEKRLIEEQSNKKAIEEEAYKWSTEDM